MPEVHEQKNLMKNIRVTLALLIGCLLLPSAEAARKPRTDDIFEKSREQGRVFQDPDTDGFASKKRPHSDKSLFAYDPATVAI